MTTDFPIFLILTIVFCSMDAAALGGKKRQNLQAFLKETVQCRKKSKKM